MRIQFRDFTGLITSFFRNDATQPRVYQFQDKDGTIADLEDVQQAVETILSSPETLQELAIAISPYLNILPVPTVQASNIVITELLSTSFRVTCTRGNGTGVLFVIKEGSAVDTFPSNNQQYLSSPVFGDGADLGSGNYVVHNGSENTFVVTGLTPNTTYYIRAFEYGGTGPQTFYLLDNAPSGNPISQTTEEIPEVAPTVQASNLVVSNVTDTSLKLDWIRGNGTHVLIVAKEGGAVDATPTDDTQYAAASNFGDGAEIGTGNFVVYNGTGTTVSITGLTPETAVHMRAFEYNADDPEYKYFTDTATGNPVNDTTLEDQGTDVIKAITFDNPSYTHKVWRHGVESTGTISIPTGWSLTGWSIVDHKTRSVVDADAGATVTQTFSYGSGCNVYDLIIVINKDGVLRSRVLPAEITVFPPKFTEAEADLVYNLASGGMGSKDGQWIDRGAGGNFYKIFVKGNHNGGQAFNPYYWRSADDTRPIHVIWSDCTITSTTRMLAPGSMENVIWDGCADEAIQYGLKTVKASGGTGENFYFNDVDTAQPTRKSRRVTIAGLHIDNVDVNRGGSCFVVNPPNTATNNWDTYRMEEFKVLNCKFENARDENIYLNHFNDALTSGRASSGGTDWMFYRIIAQGAGNEGIQFSSLDDSEFFHMTLLNNGVRNQDQHRNAFQFGGGNRNVAFYMNYIETTKNINNSNTGLHGGTVETFSNVIYSTGRVDATGYMFQIVLAEAPGVSTVYQRYKSNTIIIQNASLTSIPWVLYDQATTTNYQALTIDGNLVVTNTATTKQFANGWSPSGTELIENNKQYTSINTPLFVDHGAKNFKLASTSSPAFATYTPPTGNHPLLGYDFDGYEFIEDVYGAFSGFELFLEEEATVLNIASASTQTDITNIPNGTSFATLQSTYLPATGTVTLEDDTTRVVDITWAQGSYDGDVADTYALTGTPANLPADVTNTDTVTFSINVTVLEAEAGEPITPLGLNFMGSSSPSGFINTGSLLAFTTSPATGNGTNRNYGNVGPDGITLTAVNNSGTGDIWNATGSAGATGGSTNFPSPICQTYWYVSGTAIGQIILGNVPAGTYNLKAISSRGSIVGPRPTEMRVNGGSWQSINVTNNNSTEFEFTGVTPSSGNITIEIRAGSPTDSQFAYINGLLLTTE